MYNINGLYEIIIKYLDEVYFPHSIAANKLNEDIDLLGRIMENNNKNHKKEQEHQREIIDIMISEIKKGLSEELIKELEEDDEIIIKIVEYWRTRVEKEEEEKNCHWDAIGVSEIWNKNKEKILREEIETSKKNYQDQSELMEALHEELEEEKLKNSKLERELKEEREISTVICEQFEESKIINENLEKKLYFATKPLPKKPSKLKQLKTKLQQFKQSINKEKFQEPKMVAKIEVKTAWWKLWKN